jgi:hypothetical protein
MLRVMLRPLAGFLATVFDVFRSNQVSVDVVATSEVSISLSLDPKKCWHDGEVGGGHMHVCGSFNHN